MKKFIQCFGNMLNLFPTTNTYKIIKSFEPINFTTISDKKNFVSDKENLMQDWYNIGNDIRKAMNNFED